MSAITRYAAPTTLEEALQVLADGTATVLAGGTDLMPQGQDGRRPLGPTLLNIRRVGGLRGVAVDGGFIRIGALTTISDLLEDATVAARLPALATAADHFASDQIRNAGTVGGNICNASPAGDSIVPLLAYGAEVELASARGRRRVALKDFFTGPGRTVRAADELMTAALVPPPPPDFAARFEKFGTRPALDISTVSVGFGAQVTPEGLRGVRVAFGAAAPVPLRGARTEAALEGARLDEAVIAAAAAAARDEISPIDDVRASAWYRREMVHNLLRKILNDVAEA